MEATNDFKPAKLCFEHIGGKLGTLLLDLFIDKGWLAKHKPGDKHFYITADGEAGFAGIGLDVTSIKPEKI